MVNKIITTYRSEIEATTRLEPRFYYKSNLLKSSFAKFGYEEINNFAILKSGSVPEHSENKKNDEDYYFIKSADVKRYNLNFSTISFVVSKVHKSRLNFKIIPNDILLSSTGRLGFACIVPRTLKESSTSQNIIRIRFKEKNLTKFNPHFLLAFLNSQFGQVQMEALSTLTGQKYLNMESFRNYKIPKIDDEIIEGISQKIQNIENNEITSLSLLEQAQKFFYQKLGKKESDIPFIRTSDLVNHETDQFLDFFIPEEIYNELSQDIKVGDVLFTKDGKIGMVAMITENDRAIIWLYPALRRTVIASTLPRLREERLREFEIPILDKKSIDEITRLIKRAFGLKNEKKKLIKEAQGEIDNYFQV
ncbi:19160_t:CDS:2 [Funneliformis geosporum]|nr:19160_t:CDS:2 [Funneliformis geosporum]